MRWAVLVAAVVCLVGCGDGLELEEGAHVIVFLRGPGTATNGKVVSMQGDWLLLDVGKSGSRLGAEFPMVWVRRSEIARVQVK